MKRLRFLILLFMLPACSFAQNLVPNPGFEAYKKVPISFCRSAKEFAATVNDWNMPNQATSDYFHSMSRANASTSKRNAVGVQSPQEGQAYAGIYAYYSHVPLYREYLQVRLQAPLAKGKKYTIRFYVSLAECSDVAIDRLGVLLVKKPEKQKNNFLLRKQASVLSADSLFFADKDRWMPVELHYTAQGGERWLIIGNFISPEEMHLDSVPVNRKKYYKEAGAYYYIDNVCLAEEDENGDCSCPPVPSPDSLPAVVPEIPVDSLQPAAPADGAPLVLRSVRFDTDQAILLPVSFPSLDSLADFLLLHPELKIFISGHTDNTGDEERNRQLSGERAKAVAGYLAQKGIAASRIRFAGYGSSRPVAPNDTPEGRALNRRVECNLEE